MVSIKTIAKQGQLNALNVERQEVTMQLLVLTIRYALNVVEEMEDTRVGAVRVNILLLDK